MSDVRRLMLPPPQSRAHTPQPSISEEDSNFRRRSLSSSLSNVASLPELKKGGSKRPKFVQRASQYFIANYGRPREQNYSENVQPQQDHQPVPLEQILNSLQDDLLANTLKPLGIERNGPILRVLEGYMSLKAERDLLAEKLNAIVKQHDENVDMLEAERETWKEDEELYKAEVKRLEILIAEGRTGLSQVALARQQSLIRGTRGGRPRRSSSKSGGTTASMITLESARSSVEEQVPTTIRPTTPSRKMKLLSKSIKAHRSFLSLDLPPERPPSRLRGLSLATVDIPRHWRKKSEATSATPSIANSPAKTISSDFSSTSGDFLLDELEQKDLDKQAIEHVAKLISAANGSGACENVRLIEQQLPGNIVLSIPYDPTPRSRRHSVPTSERSSEDMPTLRVSRNLAARRGTDPMRIDTEQMAASKHSRRPFSFYAGDDRTIVSHLRTAPPDMTHHQSWSSTQSSLDMPAQRHSSLLPSAAPEHFMAQPRREDSSLSVITSLQRSPVGEGGNFSIPEGSSGTVTRSSSVFGDKINDRAPVTPKMGSTTGSGRSMMTAVRVKGMVQDLEKKGKDDDSKQDKNEQKAVKKKKTPKKGKKGEGEAK